MVARSGRCQTRAGSPKASWVRSSSRQPKALPMQGAVRAEAHQVRAEAEAHQVQEAVQAEAHQVQEEAERRDRSSSTGRCRKWRIRPPRSLIDAEVPFYQRGNKLVRPVVQPVQSFGGKSTMAAQLVEVELPYLRDTLCRHSHWIKWNATSKKWLPAHPHVGGCAGCC